MDLFVILQQVRANNMLRLMYFISEINAFSLIQRTPFLFNEMQHKRARFSQSFFIIAMYEYAHNYCIL